MQSVYGDRRFFKLLEIYIYLNANRLACLKKIEICGNKQVQRWSFWVWFETLQVKILVYFWQSKKKIFFGSLHNKFINQREQLLKPNGRNIAILLKVINQYLKEWQTQQLCRKEGKREWEREWERERERRKDREIVQKWERQKQDNLPWKAKQ